MQCLNGLTFMDYMVDRLEEKIDFELKYFLAVTWIVES